MGPVADEWLGVLERFVCDGGKRIRPTFLPGTNSTCTRSHTHFVVTEQGKVNLKGKSTWERAEALISIADPDFREGLIAEAQKMGIWRQSNKR